MATIEKTAILKIQMQIYARILFLGANLIQRPGISNYSGRKAPSLKMQMFFFFSYLFIHLYLFIFYFIIIIFIFFYFYFYFLFIYLFIFYFLFFIFYFLFFWGVGFRSYADWFAAWWQVLCWNGGLDCRPGLDSFHWNKKHQAVESPSHVNRCSVD